MENVAIEKKSIFDTCIESFGDIEDAMKSIVQRASGNTALCTEFGCGTLSCTNSLGCPATRDC